MSDDKTRALKLIRELCYEREPSPRQIVEIVDEALHAAESQPNYDTRGMIQQLCSDLNEAHNEILRLQGVKPEDYARFDWPQWSGPANSIRWAERVTGESLSKTRHR